MDRLTCLLVKVYLTTGEETNRAAIVILLRILSILRICQKRVRANFKMATTIKAILLSIADL